MICPKSKQPGHNPNPVLPAYLVLVSLWEGLSYTVKPEKGKAEEDNS